MKFFFLFLGVVLAAMLLDALVAFPVMWVWNSVIVKVFDGVSVVDYWQALGILVLCQILFKTPLPVGAGKNG